MQATDLKLFYPILVYRLRYFLLVLCHKYYEMTQRCLKSSTHKHTCIKSLAHAYKVTWNDLCGIVKAQEHLNLEVFLLIQIISTICQCRWKII